MKKSDELGIKLAKELQEFCNAEKCITCIFENKEGYCEVGYPTSWDFDDLEGNDYV